MATHDPFLDARHADDLIESTQSLNRSVVQLTGAVHKLTKTLAEQAVAVPPILQLTEAVQKLTKLLLEDRDGKGPGAERRKVRRAG